MMGVDPVPEWGTRAATGKSVHLEDSENGAGDFSKTLRFAFLQNVVPRVRGKEQAVAWKWAVFTKKAPKTLSFAGDSRGVATDGLRIAASPLTKTSQEWGAHILWLDQGWETGLLSLRRVSESF
jgi:hypothetical protein